MVWPEILFSIWKCFFFARRDSTKRVLAQLSLPHRGFVGQAAGPEVAPSSVFFGHHFIEVRCVGSGIASSTSRYYHKGHFCNQFFPKFNDTECVYDREPERSRVAS